MEIKIHKNSYKPEELSLLKEIYEQNTKELILSKFQSHGFNRSWQSIRFNALKLGLKRNSKIIKQEMIEAGKNATSSENIWTVKEDSLLKQIYEHNNQETIKNKFPSRTWRAIRGRAAKLNLRRDPELIQKEIRDGTKKTVKIRYGVEYSVQMPEFQKKTKQTNLKKRGVEWPTQSEEVRKKIKETVRKKYGVDNILQSEEIKKEIKQTNMERYGFEVANQNLEIRNKTVQTNLSKYGIENTFQLVDRVKNGMIKKYGYDSPIRIPEIKERIKQTNLKRYGVPYPSQNLEVRKKLSLTHQSPEVKEKKYKALRKKEFFSSSAEENRFSEWLLKIDPKAQHHRWHPTVKFLIDFYSPKYDLWIQFDGVYWHGKYFNSSQQGPQADGIKKIMQNDKIQNENIPNLIRFWDEESEKAIKNGTVLELIQKRINEKTELLKTDPQYSICHQFKKKIEIYHDDLKTLPFNPDNLKASNFDLSAEYMSSEIVSFIEKYEWLGTIGRPPKWCFTARFKNLLGGVVLINEPTSYSNILGKDTKKYEALIQRGATASWTPKNLGSRLIMFSCKWMLMNTEKRAFVGYADPQAGERGIIYRACGFEYLGDDFGSPNVYRHPSMDYDFTQQNIRSTASFKKWCSENSIQPQKNWFKENKFKNLEMIPEKIKQDWYSWIKKVLSESKKIKIAKKMKYALVIGKDKREKRSLEALKNYPTFEYPQKFLNIELQPNIKPNYKPSSGKTANRKNGPKIQFIIDNYGKLTKKEMAKELGETERWLKRQLYRLSKNKVIITKAKNPNEIITEEKWTDEIKAKAIELRIEFRKTNKEIVETLSRDYKFKISAPALQFWLDKFNCVTESKQNWLKKHLLPEKIWELLNKNYRMVDIVEYIQSTFQVYISDDQILTYLQGLKIPSFLQLKRQKIN